MESMFKAKKNNSITQRKTKMLSIKNNKKVKFI